MHSFIVHNQASCPFPHTSYQSSTLPHYPPPPRRPPPQKREQNGKREEKKTLGVPAPQVETTSYRDVRHTEILKMGKSLQMNGGKSLKKETIGEKQTPSWNKNSPEEKQKGKIYTVSSSDLRDRVPADSRHPSVPSWTNAKECRVLVPPTKEVHPVPQPTQSKTQDP